jgi:hypothetical protein
LTSEPQWSLRLANRNDLRPASGPPAATRTKAKFDDQIVAIAAVERATTIYSDDGDIAKLADRRFAVIKIASIPLPPESDQAELPFESDDQGDPQT